MNVGRAAVGLHPDRRDQIQAQQGQVDQIVAYVAPALLGSGHSAIGDLGAESIADLRRFNLADVSRLGNDVRLILTPLTETPLTDQGTV